jgi:hypothetical protein
MTVQRPAPALLSQEVREDLRLQVQRLERVVDDLERLIDTDNQHREQVEGQGERGGAGPARPNR